MNDRQRHAAHLLAIRDGISFADACRRVREVGCTECGCIDGRTSAGGLLCHDCGEKAS